MKRFETALVKISSSAESKEKRSYIVNVSWGVPSDNSIDLVGRIPFEQGTEFVVEGRT